MHTYKQLTRPCKFTVVVTCICERERVSEREPPQHLYGILHIPSITQTCFGVRIA
jgi:hypothetical protein